MQLAPPNIAEQLSVCSRRVRLTGQSQGAVVLLRGAGDRPLGKWTATWPDELFDLDPGVMLQAGEPVATPARVDVVSGRLAEFGSPGREHRLSHLLITEIRQDY
jgi:hypothetical protein